MNEQSMRFRVGLFVLGGIILLAVLIVMFGGLPTALKSQNTFTIDFRSAPGVEPGTPVRRSGIRIGEVKDVQLLENGTVRVTIGVDKKYPLLTTDRPRISQSLLGGDTAIEFVPAAPAADEKASGEEQEAEAEAAKPPVAQPGHEFKGGDQDTRELIHQAKELLPVTRETLEDIRRSLRRLEKMSPEIEQTAREYRELAKSVREMLPELRRTNTEVQKLATSTREMIPELRKSNDEIQATARTWNRLGERLNVLVETNQDKVVKAIDSFNDTMSRVGSTFNDENQRNIAVTLRNARQSSETLRTTTQNADELMKESRQTVQRLNDSITRGNAVIDNLQQASKPFADRSERISKNLDEGSAKLNQTLDSAQGLFGAVNQGNGTLRLLLNDPSLYNNLNDAACMLTRAMPRLDRILHDVEVFADKIARHPESLGVRGAVKPSSGLKETPAGDSYYYPQH